MLPPPHAGEPAQIGSTGPDVRQPPTDRLFFALYPDADSAARIVQLAQQLRARHGLKGKSFAAARLHVTLHLLGDYTGGLPQPVVDAACRAAAALSLPRLDVAFDRAASFVRRPRNRPFVLRHAVDDAAAGDHHSPLAAAQRAVGAAMAAAGLRRRPDGATGVPHMTLLYDDRCVDEHAVEPVIGWAAHEFVLVHSLLGRGRHVPIARWPLGG